MTPEELRDELPALARWAWLDTPGSPPMPTRVHDALAEAMDHALSGDFDWSTWDAAVDRTRAMFAQLCGVDPSTVATVGSLAEAAATVARGRPPGVALLGDDEFQSLLLPFLAEASRDSARPTELATRAEGQSRTDALLDRLRPGVELVAVSETTTHDGELVDIGAIKARAAEVGAELLVNLTQSLGAKPAPAGTAAPDYLAAHGYKWLLAPRGAAWLHAAPTARADLRSIAPGWKTAEGARGLFGGSPLASEGLKRCDISQAWLPFIGAEAALGLIGALDLSVVEQHALDLADRFEHGALALGARRVRAGRGSHIRVVRIKRPDEVARALVEADVKARVVDDRLRIGVHGFNVADDIERALAALRTGMGT